MADDGIIAQVDQVQLVVFTLANEAYGVEIASVREIIRMQSITRVPKTPEYVEGVIDLRGKVIPVLISLAYIKDDNGDPTPSVLVVSRDITERKLAEREILKLTSAMGQANDGVAIFRRDDNDRQISYVNEAFSKMLGYQQQELIGTDFRYVMNKLIDTEYESLSDILDLHAPTTQTLEVEHIRKDDSVFPARLSIAYVKNEEGELTDTVVVVSRDITEQKMAEEALKGSNETLTRIMDNVRGMVMVIDRDFNIVHVNDAYVQASSYTREEIIGKKCYAFRYRYKEPCSAQGRPCPVEAVFDKRDPVLSEITHHDDSGELITLETHSVPLFDEKGDIRYVAEMSYDVTEKKEAEQEIVKLSSAVEQTMDGVVIVDLQKRIVYANRAFASMHEYTVEEVVGKQLKEFHGKTGASLYKEFREETLGTGSATIEAPRKRKDGTVFPASVSFTRLKDAKGEATGFIGVVRDITESKMAEEKLAFLSRVAEQVTDSIVITDNEYKISYINKAAEDLYGYAPEELIGQRPDVLNAEPTAPEIQQEIYETVARGAAYEGTYLNRRKDGSTFMCEFKVSALQDKDGKVTAYMGVQRDVTQRTQWEDALKESEHRFRQLADLLPQTVFEITMEGNFTFCNRLGFESNGYVQEDIDNGLNVMQIITPEDRQKAMFNMQSVAQGVKSTGNEYTIVRKDGSKYPAIIFSSPIIRDDKPVGLRGIVIDITERVNSEREIRDHRAKLRSILDTAPYGIMVADIDGNIYEANNAMIHLHGYESKVEFTEQSVADLISPRSSALIWDSMKELLAKIGYIEAIEFTMVNKQGDEFIAELGAAMLKDGSGQKVGFVCAVRDVTERRQAYDALIDSEEKLRAIFDTSPVGIIVSDAKGTILDMNKTLLRMHGFDHKEEVVGRNSMELCSHKDHFKAKKCFEDLFENGITTTDEYTLLTKDGNEFEVELSNSLFRDKQGRPFGLIGAAVDITERKRAEEEIRRLGSAVEQSIDGIAISDLEPNLLFVNHAFAQMHGYTPDEMIGMKVGGLHTVEQQEEFRERIKTISQEGSWTGEIGHMKKDGSEFPTFMTTTLLRDEQGNPAGVLALAKDITEQKRTEEEILIKNNLVESSVNAIGMADLEGNMTYVNQSWLQLFGYSGFDEVAGKSVADFYVEKQKVAEIVDALGGKGVWVGEMIIVKADGSTADVMISASVIRDESGNPICSTASFVDITERKRAEQEIRQLSSAVEQSIDGIATVNNERELVYVNSAFADIYGYTRDEMQGMWLRNLFKGRPVSAEGETFWDRVGQYGSATIECYHVKKDYTPIPVLLSVTELRGADGKKTGAVLVVKDITERKRADEEIHRLGSAVEQSIDGIAVADLEKHLIYVNGAFASMYGYTPEELMGKQIKDLLPSAEVYDSKGVLEDVRSQIRQQGFASREAKHAKRDGTVFPVMISVTMLKDTDGKENGALFVAKDITDAKRAEEEIRRLSSAVEQSVDGMAITNTERRFIYVNTAFADMYDYSREQMIGMRIRDLLSDEHSDRHIVFRQQVEKHGSGALETEHTTAKGKLLPVLVSVNTLIGDDGKPAGLIFINKDITELKQAERQITELNAAVSQSTDGVVITHGGMNITYVNESFAQMHGYTVDEMIGMRFDAVVSEDRLGDLIPDMRRLRKLGSWTGKTHHVKKDGTVFPVYTTANVFRDSKGKYAGFLSIARDATEMMRIDEERQKAERLESLGTLAGGIAHDFNNLLTGIMGNVSLAKRYVGQDDSVGEMMTETEKACLRAKDLTQQLLTFAKGGAPIKRLASIRELIEDTTNFTLVGSRVKCKFNISNDIAAVEIDEGQMSQVINNLVINAAEAMPNGGVIKIEAFNLSTELAESLPANKAGYIEIVISDKGIGISQEYIDRIFEPYFTTKQKGSGLGLATTYSIVRNHGGDIRVESEPGVGTSFHIQLPASRKKSPVRQVPKRGMHVNGKGKILVVDDEEVIRMLLNRVLTDVGYKVDLVADGAEAIERYRKAKESGEPFDAVIMDLTIPGGMGGQEAVGKILEIDPDANVIASSGYSTDSVLADYKKYGFSAVATKPYTLSDLEQTLQQTMNS